MNFRQWYDRYSTDCKLKYPSERTQENYLCSVGTFQLTETPVSIQKLSWWKRFILWIKSLIH
ncbi:MAG: hypothetical protein WCI04_00270 [archaeon]